MRRPRSQVLLLAVTLLSVSLPSFAGNKLIQLDTVPPGAQVEINGSMSCVTPCSIRVPGYYFGKKRTAFSSHGIEPIHARFTKQGYVPKTVDLTTELLHWRNLYGNNLYDYYLMKGDQFKFQMDSVQEFIPSNAPAPTTTEMARATTSLPLKSTEEVVREALPAVVAISTSKGSGSGFFVTSDGVVVTNAHVVQGETSVTVLMSSGKSLESTHIYADEGRDLALIKVQVKDGPFLKLSLSSPATGSDVVAIGTPGAHDVTGTLLLPNTVTKGIVSGIREFPEDTTASVAGRAGLWIQTDATINHGNSGGPLLNRSGEVVGINTLAFTATGTPGLNFALASSELAKILQSRFGVQPSRPAPVSTQSDLVQASSTTSSAVRVATDASTVSFISVPSGADIQVDGQFLGSAPAELPLTLGQRTIKISKKGFKPYERTIQVLSSGSQRITAELEPD